MSLQMAGSDRESRLENGEKVRTTCTRMSQHESVQRLKRQPTKLEALAPFGEAAIPGASSQGYLDEADNDHNNGLQAGSPSSDTKVFVEQGRKQAKRKGKKKTKRNMCVGQDDFWRFVPRGRDPLLLRTTRTERGGYHTKLNVRSVV